MLNWWWKVWVWRDALQLLVLFYHKKPSSVNYTLFEDSCSCLIKLMTLCLPLHMHILRKQQLGYAMLRKLKRSCNRFCPVTVNSLPKSITQTAARSQHWVNASVEHVNISSCIIPLCSTFLCSNVKCIIFVF